MKAEIQVGKEKIVDGLECFACSHKDYVWRSVICDEATPLRSQSSMTWRMIRLLPKMAFGAVTATPAHNRIEDIKGFSLMIFLTSELPGLCPCDGISALDIIRNQARPTYAAGSANLWTIAPASENDRVRDLQRVDNAYGFKWWFLFPQVQDAVGDEYTTAILKANRMFVICRGMGTGVNLPNGMVYFPQIDIPPMKIVGVELGYQDDQDFVTQTTDSLLLSVTKRGGAFEQAGASSQDNLDRLPQHDHSHGGGALPTGTKKSHGHLNFQIVRMLGYLAHDIHAFELVKVDDKMNSCPPQDLDKGLSEVEKHAKEGIRSVMAVADGKTSSVPPPASNTRKSEAALSSKLVHSIAVDCYDGGLNWAFLSLDKSGGDYVPGPDPGPTIKFTINKSPLLAYILQECIQWNEAKEKAVIMVNHPWMQA